MAVGLSVSGLSNTITHYGLSVKFLLGIVPGRESNPSQPFRAVCFSQIYLSSSNRKFLTLPLFGVSPIL